MTDSRLLIVANRLPVTVRVNDGGIETVPSSGGLASGLGRCHHPSRGAWFGWPGHSTDSAEQRRQIDAQLSTLGMEIEYLNAEDL